MWRDRLDAFWDGRRALAIGFFEEGETTAALGPLPELTVVSAPDAAFRLGAALVDAIDAKRWRCGHFVLELPLEHLHVSLRAPDGTELRLALTGDKSAQGAGGETRLLLVETDVSQELADARFRVASLTARGEWERLARELIARSGAKLVWAISQRRQIERSDGAATAMRLWPAERSFPAHQSRIVLESIETAIPRGDPMLKAPFAIMENWLRENGAPCPALRIRIPNAFDQSDFALGWTAIVLVLHQRRRFREWVRKQRDAGEPIVDPLLLEDIRRATGNARERPEAVEAEGSIVVYNLANVVADRQTELFDGFSVRLSPDIAGSGSGLVVEIHFFGASLGDDVGLVSAAAGSSDLGVVPDDPGGVRYARLFRVGGDGLVPLRVDGGDALVDEILRLAADEGQGGEAARLRIGGERAASAQGRRERLLAVFNLSLGTAGYAGRLQATRPWDIFEPILMSSFVDMIADAPSEARHLLQRLGGYDAYRADPSLVQAVVRRHELAAEIDEAGFREHRGEATSLPQRFAAAMQSSGLVVANADLATQVRIWRLLGQQALVARIVRARVATEGEQDVREIAHVVDMLLEEAIVERAAIYCDDLFVEDEARSLRDYLARRREGQWTPFVEAARLAVIVEEANAYWRQIEAERASAPAREEPPPPPSPPKQEGLLATVRNFFLGGSRRRT